MGQRLNIEIRKDDKILANQEYRKIVGTRNTMKKAEELEYIMIERIGIDYYIDIEVQDEI